MGVRTYPDKPRIYLDMDGVVADFDAEAKIRGIDGKQLKAIPGIYKKLPLIEGASEGVFALVSMGWQVFFLTKIPSENTTAATDKLNWVNEWFPMIGERVVITPDKGCVGTQRDYLVDDHPEWANAHNFEGIIIHFNRFARPAHPDAPIVIKDWSGLVGHFREILRKAA